MVRSVPTRQGHLPDPGRAAVKLSVFTVLDDAGPGRDRPREAIALAEAADRAGFSGLWVAEHHFTATGLCPSPPVLLAACGARTTRLRLGALVAVLPFHRPVDLAEEYALLDRLVGGRVNMGLGSGYIPAEFAGYGIDPASRHERFDRAYDTLVRAMAGEPVEAGGPGDPPVRLNVLPVQRPHPPFWIAVQRREAIPYVARRGASVALIPYATVRDLEELAEEIREFRAAARPDARQEVAVALHVYAGPDPAHARAAFRRYLDDRHHLGSPHLEAKAQRDARQVEPAALETAGLAAFGSPSEVEARLAALAKIGVDEVLGIFDFGGLSPTEAIASVESLGRLRRDEP